MHELGEVSPGVAIDLVPLDGVTTWSREATCEMLRINYSILLDGLVTRLKNDVCTCSTAGTLSAITLAICCHRVDHMSSTIRRVLSEMKSPYWIGNTPSMNVSMFTSFGSL